jgi:hypothetical protein
MKRLAIVVILGIIGGNIYAGSTEYSREHPIMYTAEAEEPRVVLIGTTTPEKSIEEKIRETFPEDADRAVAIAKCESGLNPKAVSPTNDHGLMQINKTVHTVEGDIYDVDTNLQFARKLYDERGWEPWVCNDIVK